ncbi:hypothetical protein [Vibrio ichthyoenteri]|nr:hypothetical protein [Vibrio ichthyoenteri]
MELSVIIGNDTFGSSPSNREKLCVVKGFEKESGMKIDIYPNNHSRIGTLRALKKARSEVIVLPLLTNELLEWSEFKSFSSKNSAYVFTSSVDIPPSLGANYISVTPNIGSQLDYLLKEFKGKEFTLIGDNGKYTELIRELLYMSDVQYEFLYDNEIHKLGTNYGLVLMSLPRSRVLAAYDKLDNLNRKMDVVSFDVGAITDVMKKRLKINNLTLYSVKNWSGEVSSAFKKVYMHYCSNVQKKPTYLNIATYDALSAATAKAKNKEFFWSERIQGFMKLTEREQSFILEKLNVK